MSEEMNKLMAEWCLELERRLATLQGELEEARRERYAERMHWQQAHDQLIERGQECYQLRADLRASHDARVGAERDAARYRWLRSIQLMHSLHIDIDGTVTKIQAEPPDIPFNPESLDTAIDTALTAAAEREGGEGI